MDQGNLGNLGRQRHSIGGVSVVSNNSQSDSRSYRERLREHIQSVKEQAGTSVASAANPRLKTSYTAKSSKNFNDVLAREENEIGAALERHNEIRKKWNHIVQSSLKVDSAHNFFTHEWEEDNQQVKEETSSPKGTVDDISDGEHVKLMTKDYLGLSEEWQLLECYIEPTTDNLSLRLHKENLLYHYPLDLPVKLEEKLGSDFVPSYIEEEGFYINPRPVWSSKSYNKLQRRLITEGRKHWFGEDGEVKTVLEEKTDISSDHLLVPVYKNAEMLRVADVPERPEPAPRTTYLLELFVASVIWLHHPLCSPEHVAARRVLSCYYEYSERLQAGFSRRLGNKLKALRTARDNAKQTGDPEKYQRYKNQVRVTRTLWLEEGKKDRLAIVHCLKSWLELRRMRSQQGYTVTPVKLSIMTLNNSEDNSLNEDDNEWDAELQCQLSERLEEEEDEYKNKIQESKHEENNKDTQILRRSPSELFDEVKSKLVESLRPPGEPVIVLELREQSVTPEAEIQDFKEIERRIAQKQCHLSILILHNKQVVCQSRSLSLFPQFNASANQMFSLQVSDWPQSLSLQLVMEGGIGPGKRLSTSVFIPIPSRAAMLASAPLDKLEFNSPEKLGPYSHAGVGCGLPDSCGNVLYAGGNVVYKIGWGNSSWPPQMSTNIRTPRRTINQVTNMREWAAKAQLDPNNPGNADLLELIKNDNRNTEQNKGQNESLPDGEFCSMSEIENNSRIKLMSLRNQMVPEFRDIRCIPIRDKEIPDDIFKLYEKRTQSPLRSGPGLGETGLEWQREWSNQQLQQIQDTILQHCRQTHHYHSLSQVVLEDRVPDIGTLGLTFMKWLQPKRPLRPTRKERKKLPVMGLVGQEVEVS